MNNDNRNRLHTTLVETLRRTLMVPLVLLRCSLGAPLRLLRADVPPSTFLRRSKGVASASRLLRVAVVMGMMILGGGVAWGQTYYAIHQNGKGYLRVNGANVNLTNDGTFRYGDIFDDNGSSLWVFTSDGYLKNNYFYLNVANNSTLYLSVDPVTQWTLEDIDGQTKKHIKINDGTEDLYLCNDNAIKLATSPSSYYNACPITLTEKKWSGPTTSDLTLQSPQLITYLRGYFTQNIDYSFVNDAGTTVSEKGKDRRVYATYSYVSGGSNKGTDWDITSDGIIYNKKAKDNVAVTATYNVSPADPIALASHSTASVMSNRKFTILQKALSPTANMDYLFFSIKGGDDYRYPYDDGITQDNPVKADGKGGTKNTSVLSDPLNDGSGRNQQISWKITTDEAGFCMFQNTSTGRYLYFYEPKSNSGSIGELRVGATTLPTDATLSQYKFRLFKTSTTDYSTCYYIIPYSKLFAVYKSDGIATSLYASLNITNSKNDNTIRLFNSNDDSKWCIYKYEAEYRLRTDFTFSGPASTDATGNITFTSIDGWYGKYIKESPSTGNGQRGLVISGSYNTNKINYIWTVIGLDDYINHTDWTSRDGGYGQTFTNVKTFTFNVSSLPVSTAAGIVQLQLRGGENDQNSTTNPYKFSEKKTLGFTILGDGTVVFTDISSLSDITNSSGAYRLTADVSYSAPGVTTFSGILDCNNKTISGLTAPLFTNLTNGTVCNLNLSGVDVSQDGQVGAIACVANGGSRIYNVGILDGSVGSTSTSTVNNSVGCCGGLVGLLDGSARVINCFSYANITGGNRVGGIVGYNNFETKSSDARTMVMNCMFYGDITGGTNKAPIYNGKIITNRGENSGVSNFNYFLSDAPYVKNRQINTANCALMAEPRFLQRFEFFRHLLNGHRELAGWWVTGTYSGEGMHKWVMIPDSIGSDHPFPILMVQGKYPSVVNYEPSNDATKPRSQGRKMGELTVNIQKGNGGAEFSPAVDAEITTSQLTLNITDKDTSHFHFNYYSVQLPYYNDVGTNNYRKGSDGFSRVVTGWKIVSITVNGVATTEGTGAYSTGDDVTFDASGNITATPYNFADRTSTKKDLYSVSGRVFNQGAYWDVPEGVTAITIEPYWAKAAYLADAYPDVVYNQAMGTPYNVPNVGGGQKYTNNTNYSIAGEQQKVYTSVGNARDALGKHNTHTVYDYAIVLVGNAHNIGISSDDGAYPYSLMSIDLDHDNEPDYSYILRFNSRNKVHPVRVDFLNIPGLGMAQKSSEGTGTYNFGIMQPIGWFETTNTSLFRETQFEYDITDRSTAAPLILQGGVMEQWVNSQNNNPKNLTTYFLVGGNVWFKEFHRGTHQDKQFSSKHPPVSVTGGDYDEFHLTGLYRANANIYDDNAECYISGGRFGVVAGTGMDGIGTTDGKGNITWIIDGADIKEFYAGSFNAAYPARGNLNTIIKNSYVEFFCGGPKFGDMLSGRTVVTTATDCIFGEFYGAGYGGNSYNRQAPYNANNKMNINWNKWIKYENGERYGGNGDGDNATYNGYCRDYKTAFDGVSTRFNYQFIPMSGNADNCARLWIEYVKFSLATTRSVTSNLKGCTIMRNFYGGGSLGKVDGDVTSILESCIVKGNVFGAGYSASLPPVEVDSIGFRTEPYYYTDFGNYGQGVKGATTRYTWAQTPDDARIANAGNDAAKTARAIDQTNHILYTDENLSKSNLGSVTTATLTLKGNTTVGTQGDDDTGNVYGGGDESIVSGNTTVILQDGVHVLGNVYGGGNNGTVGGTSSVTIENE